MKYMKVLVSLFVIALLPSSALAVNCKLPPKQFDHEPTHRYKIVVDPSLCGNAFTDPSLTTIILPSPHCTSAAWRSCYLRHEKGHVNGWAGHHPMMKMSGDRSR